MESYLRPPPQQSTAMPGSLIASIALFGLAVVGFVLLQFGFMHWSTGTATGTGPDGSFQWTTWSMSMEAGPVSETSGYWDDEKMTEDETGELAPGTWPLRFGGILLILAGALGLVAGVGAVLRKSLLTNVLGWAAVTCGAPAAVLFWLGMDQMQSRMGELLSPQGVSSRFDLGSAFYVAVATVVVLALATSLGPAKPKKQSTKPVYMAPPTPPAP